MTLRVFKALTSGACAFLVLLSPAGVSTASAQATGTIAGTITSQVTSLPVPGPTVSVVIYDADGNNTGGATVDASGLYQATRAPGVYFVKVEATAGYVPELHDNITCVAAACHPTSGTPVVVLAGTTTTVNIALAQSGTLSGVVRRAGAGVPGLDVHIYDSSTSLVGTQTTGTGGTFAFEALAPGSYYVRPSLHTVLDSLGAPQIVPPPPPFEVVDFVPRILGGPLCPTHVPVSDCRIADGTPVAVTAGNVTSINVTLDPAGAIGGSVVMDGTGAPLLAMVTAFAGDVPAGTARTNAAGQYTITGLPTGSYRVRTVMSGLVVDEWSDGRCVGCPGTPAAIAVAAGSGVTGVNFSLPPGGAISGTVTCQVPLVLFTRHPRIEVYSANGTLVRTHLQQTLLPCTTFQYTVDGLAPGQYYLLARDTPSSKTGSTSTIPGGDLIDELYGDIPCVTVDCDVRRGAPVTVVDGQTTGSIDFTLSAGGTIIGLGGAVASGGRQLPLQIFDSRGVELTSVLRRNLFGADDFTGLPPGTYFVKVGNTLFGGVACAGCPPTSGTPIVVGSGFSVIEPVYTAAAVHRISGTVTASTGGGPLSTITVELLSAASGGVISSTTTDLFGRYAFSAVAPARYYVRTSNDRGYVDEVYQNLLCARCNPVSMPTGGTPAVINPTADVGNVDFALADAGVLSGTVTDSAGVALSGVPVSLFSSAGTIVGSLRSSTAGNFRLNLPADTYRSRAEASRTHRAEIYSEMSCTSASCEVTAGTAIPLAVGARVSNVAFTLASCDAMTLSPGSLATAIDGRAYRQVLTASGGVGPFAFAVTDGALPQGTMLDGASGVLSGAAAAPGRYPFVVSATDANGCATARDYTLDVQDCAFSLSPASATLPAAGGTQQVMIVDSCGSQAIVEREPWLQAQATAVDQVSIVVEPNPFAAARQAAVSIGRRVFTVRQAGTTALPPFGWLDTPGDGAQVSGSIPVSGWALDDLEVVRVRIYRDAVPLEPPGLTYVGDAVFIPGARPDVQQGYPSYPNNDRAGWGFLILTNTLPNGGNGGFRIHAIAEDGEGQSFVLGSRQIFANNATAAVPFGTIDTPAQGGTIAGSSYLNWGWALTPLPGTIPLDGSTMQVILDGAPIGGVTYNLPRADIAAIFPGLNNSSGPIAYRPIDPTALADGLHTISWTVTDNLGRTSGIGSRYFTVANSADVQGGLAAAPDSGRTAASLETAPVDDAMVTAQRDAREPRRVRLDPDGTRDLVLRPMERLELSLGEIGGTCAATWAGYQVKQEVLSDLPVGASLDGQAGVFYWEPGPGFAGVFDLLFVRTDCTGRQTRVPVRTTIQPR